VNGVNDRKRAIAPLRMCRTASRQSSETSVHQFPCPWSIYKVAAWHINTHQATVKKQGAHYGQGVDSVTGKQGGVQITHQLVKSKPGNATHFLAIPESYGFLVSNFPVPLVSTNSIRLPSTLITFLPGYLSRSVPIRSPGKCVHAALHTFVQK
jgi:hypothetical protein